MNDEIKSEGDCHPRVAVIWYGSLLAKDQMREISADAPKHAIPVKVDGFKRTFDQQSSWRGGEGNELGVATIVKDSGSWFNGVLVTDLDRDEFKGYLEREEAGYRMIEIKSKEIKGHYESNNDSENDKPPIDDIEIILAAEGHKRRDDIVPKPKYVDICRRGAEQWGREFYEDFLVTSEGISGKNTD